ncbi:hypothetical protein ACMG4P_23880 [Pseudovibrio denitrificans]|uniref:hypothetical protein n=1 Tax=Pseudovibrio denitrificans TaxID=258256 RepID=UPI0039BF49DB
MLAKAPFGLNSKWHRYITFKSEEKHKLRTVAVSIPLFIVFRSGCIWLSHSKRFADLKVAIISFAAAQNTPRMVVVLEAQAWLVDRQTHRDIDLEFS